MIPDIRTKIRALIQDTPKPDFQIFAYSNSNVFKLAEPNIEEVTQVLVNGVLLGSGQSFDFVEDSNEVTISGVSFNVDDLIEVRYTFTKYSDSELTEYIRASLSWANVFEVGDDDFEIDEPSDDIFPSLSKTESNLIALVASILICPDYTSYKLPNLSVSYPVQMPKDERIVKLITRFRHGIGTSDVVQWGDWGF